MTAIVDQNDLIGLERAFVDATGRNCQAQRITLYREVERIVLRDAPWITQQYFVLEYLYQPYVQGVELSLLGKRDMPLRKIWLKYSPATSAVGGITNGEPR